MGAGGKRTKVQWGLGSLWWRKDKGGSGEMAKPTSAPGYKTLFAACPGATLEQSDWSLSGPGWEAQPEIFEPQLSLSDCFSPPFGSLSSAS